MARKRPWRAQPQSQAATTRAGARADSGQRARRDSPLGARAAEELRRDQERRERHALDLGAGGEGRGDADLGVAGRCRPAQERRKRQAQSGGHRPVRRAAHAVADAEGRGGGGEGHRAGLDREARRAPRDQGLAHADDREGQEERRPEHRVGLAEGAGEQRAGRVELGHEVRVVGVDAPVPRPRQVGEIHSAGEQELLRLDPPVVDEIGKEDPLPRREGGEEEHRAGRHGAPPPRRCPRQSLRRRHRAAPPPAGGETERGSGGEPLPAPAQPGELERGEHQMEGHDSRRQDQRGAEGAVVRRAGQRGQPRPSPEGRRRRAREETPSRSSPHSIERAAGQLGDQLEPRVVRGAPAAPASSRPSPCRPPRPRPASRRGAAAGRPPTGSAARDRSAAARRRRARRRAGGCSAARSSRSRFST